MRLDKPNQPDKPVIKLIMLMESKRSKIKLPI